MSHHTVTTIELVLIGISLLWNLAISIFIFRSINKLSDALSKTPT